MSTRSANRRLAPRPWQPSYLLLRTLAAQMRIEAQRRLSAEGEGVDILDVGCGERPYEPLLSPYSASYVGLDMNPRPAVDVVAPAEALPFDNDLFGCAICSQVLEHSNDPNAVVREMHRVLRPGGVAFCSTHGTVNYHPNPDDYWRWTHTGLARLFREEGSWDDLRVYANGGTATALSYMTTRELKRLENKAPVKLLLAPVTMGLNMVAWRLDRRVRNAYPLQAPTLAPNYLLVATKMA